ADLEMSLARLKTLNRPQQEESIPTVLTLSLVDDDWESDQAMLENIASRLESRNSLALQLLGQRLGVLGAAPAYEGEALPLGPQARSRASEAAADMLELSRYGRVQLFNQFEKMMSGAYPALRDVLNNRLIEDGIL